jgi:hypothetical protein
LHSAVQGLQPFSSTCMLQGSIRFRNQLCSLVEEPKELDHISNQHWLPILVYFHFHQNSITSELVPNQNLTQTYLLLQSRITIPHPLTPWISSIEVAAFTSRVSGCSKRAETCLWGPFPSGGLGGPAHMLPSFLVYLPHRLSNRTRFSAG